MYQLNINHTFNAPVQQLFNAWKNPETIRKWFAPGEDMHVPQANADVREGGQYRIVMQNAEGEQFIVGGQYLQVIENKQLVFSWQWEGSPHTTRVELTFNSVNDSTCELHLVHSEFPDQEMCDKHQMGWDGCLAKLLKLELAQ